MIHIIATNKYDISNRVLHSKNDHIITFNYLTQIDKYIILLFTDVEIALDGNNEINIICTTNLEEDSIPSNSGIFIYSLHRVSFISSQNIYDIANVKNTILHTLRESFAGGKCERH